MRKILLGYLIISFTHITFSQWVVRPTITNLGLMPSISAASPTIAWAAGNTNEPVFYETTNGAVSWFSVPGNGIANNVGIYCIWGADASTAYCGSGTGNAKVFRTTNGGTAWIQLFNIPGGTSFINGILFSRSNPSFGIAHCDPPNGPGTPYMIQTSQDAGNAWNQLTPSPPGIPGLMGGQHSVFIIDNLFYGFGADNSGVVDITTDGGISWTPKSVGGSGFVSGITFATNKLSGFAAVNSNGLYKTTDGGGTWSSVSIPGIDGAALPYVYWVPSTNVVYASSSGGGIKRSTDWGVTWTAMTTGGQTDIRHMDFVVSVGLVYGYAIAGNGTTLSLIDTLSALPVQMNYFNCSIDGNNVNLNWETNLEINNSGFNVERAFCDNNWQTIGFVHGYGNKSTPSQYHFKDKGLQKGTYQYRLKQIDYNGNYEYFNLNSDAVIEAPKTFSISQNYPNPFNPQTNINYSLPNDMRVSLKVYDIRGSLVALLVDAEVKAGFYTASLNASNLPSGIYFYKFVTAGYQETKKMVIVK